MLTIEEWNHLKLAGGFVNLTACVKLRLTGPDALRYLNGQVTNDIRRLEPGHSMPACLCTHKGRLEALVLISRDADGAFYLSADGALRDFLPLRVEKYLVADDAVLEDVSEQFAMVHGFGEAGTWPGAARAFAASRFGRPGTDFWIATEAFRPETVEFVRPEAADLLRIDRGIPAWETELADGVLPPEARLDESAIDYHKGCYTGQEVISRLRSVGQVNRRLERLLIPGGQTAAPGWTVQAEGEAGARSAAGVITSVAWHPVLATAVALGFIRRAAASSALVTGAPDGPSVTGVEIRKPLDD